MRTLYIDCGMGAAGDMLTAALFELLDEQQAAGFLEKVNSLGLKDLVFEAEPSVKCGIQGTHMTVTIHGAEEESLDYHADGHTHSHDEGHSHADGHTHSHDEGHSHADGHTHSHDEAQGHTHNHSHSHSHRSMKEVESIIASLPVSAKVKKDVEAVYRLFAEAEGHVHGKEISEIHFHEVGNMDAIADVTAVCMLIEQLGIDKIVASAVHVGSGHVHCAHGILPVPAPATAYLLRDIPVYSGEIKGELCTPTGAALLKYFVDDFGNMPVMKLEKVGYGMGKKDFPIANCVRVMLGESADNTGRVVELSCNMDDITAERIAFAEERLFEAGALEVYSVNVGMKKSRPGIMLCVMCREADREKMIELIFKHTTTIGIRENISNRYTLRRKMDSVNTEYGSVRIKCSDGYGVYREKYEYEDLAKIAKEHNLSIAEVCSLCDKARG